MKHIFDSSSVIVFFVAFIWYDLLTYWHDVSCVILAADFRLQVLDSAARIESPEYARLQLKPVCSDMRQTFI